MRSPPHRRSPLPLPQAGHMENDARKQYERLVRRLLNYPNRPAVIQMNAWSWFNMGDPKGR